MPARPFRAGNRTPTSSASTIWSARTERAAPGLYIWPSRAAAEQAHDAAWRASIERRTGSTPQIAYFSLMMLLDNEASDHYGMVQAKARNGSWPRPEPRPQALWTALLPPPGAVIYARHLTRGPWPRRPSGGADRKAGAHKSAADQPENDHGAARLLHAPAVGSWRAFRPSGPPLESEDGRVHLRHPQQHPYHRPRPDRADAAPRARGGERHRRQGRPHPVRRHQTAGAGRHRRGGQEVRAVLRQFALARRHADQLEDDLAVDQAPAQARRDAQLERGPGLYQEGAADAARASATSSTARWAASRTWAVCRTCCS